MFDATSPSEAELAARAVRDADLQRSDGAVRIAMGRRGDETCLVDLFQRSPARAILPRIDGRAGGEVVLVNTAGGIAGGDRMSVSVTVRDRATCVVTTQAAEKIYRALDSAARIDTAIEARDGALCEWLPQETIAFDGARLDRRTNITVSSGGRALALEWLVLGRAAHGERMRTGSLRDRWRVVRDGRLVWADALRLEGDIAALAARRSLLAGGDTLATLIYAAPDAASLIEPACEAASDAPCHAGATVVSGVLVCRFVSAGASKLRHAVAAMLGALRPNIAGAGAALPRVWGF
jgi:urease accessory protein